MNKYKFLLKSTGVLSISSFSTKLISFFLVPLYTAILTTEDYGTISLISSAISLLIPFFTFNIIDSIVVFTIKYKNVDKIASIVFRYILFSFSFFAIILLLNRYIEFLNLNGLTCLVFLLFAVIVSSDMLNEFAKATEHINEIAVAGFISSFTVIIFNILFVLVMKLGVIGYLTATILGILSSCVYLFVRLKAWKHISLNFDSALNKEMIKYAFPLIATTIGWKINSSGDKYISAYFFGAGVTGLLSVAYKIPGIISIFNGIFSRSWQVSAVKEYLDVKQNPFYTNVFVYLNAFLTIIGSCLIAADKILAKFLFSKDFYHAWCLVPFLVLSSIFGFIAGFLGPILTAKLDNKTIAKSTVYSAILNIVLNISFSATMGVIGLTIATMISSLFIYFYRRRVIGKLIAGNDSIIYLSWMLLILQSVFRIYSEVELLSWLPIIGIIILYHKQIGVAIKKTFVIIRKYRA